MIFKHINIRKVVLLYAFTAFFNLNIFAKSDTLKFKYPLDIPMSLSANYGELRKDHFHNGVDFRVGGVIGAPVYATEDGYISRIVVSPTGYGNGLYITHNNGFCSVYGHLDSFADNIRDYVLAKQYESESFDQDLFLDKNVFPIKKGDFLGKAGNSGSSGGPHLHFEIRDSLNLPLNLFKREFLPIKDKVSPIFNGIAFYGFSMDSVGVAHRYYIGRELYREKYSSEFSKGNIIKLPQKSYIAIDAVDKMEGTPAKLAVEEYRVFLDDSLIFKYNVGEVPFSKGKYINSLLEYRQLAIRNKAYIKTYVEPGCILKDKIFAVNNGLIELQDTLKHTLKIEVLDYLNNKSEKKYTIIKDTSLFNNQYDSIKGSYATWILPNLISQYGIDVYIPVGALYSPIYVNIDTLQVGKYLTPIYQIGNETVPLHNPITLNIPVSLPDNHRNKAVLIKINDDGKEYGIVANYDTVSQCVVGNVYSFGMYAVGLDLYDPEVSVNIKDNEALRGDKIVFNVKDYLSGIKKYRAEIDGRWVLAEYDAKYNKITVPLKFAKIKRGKHLIKFEVEDGVGNKFTVNRNFTW